MAPEDATDENALQEGLRAAELERGKKAQQHGSAMAARTGKEEAPEFALGAVRRLVMKDFMTYESSVLDAGPRLNLIIAKNGAGKSTTLLALALGLGGHPRLLGRASNIAGFIRHGQSKARVEVTLHDPERNHCTVIREIERVDPKSARAKEASQIECDNGDDDDDDDDDEDEDDEEKRGSSQRKPKSSSSHRQARQKKRASRRKVSAVSTWWLNGKVSSEKKVRSFLKKRYNTQVDNLCQVLPQDKVTMFSRLDETQLLTETIRAGIGQACVDEQQEIIKEQIALSQAAVTVKSAQEELEQKEREIDTLHEKVKRLEERQQAIERMELCAKRLLHLEILTLKKESDDLKKRMQTAYEAVKASKVQLANAKARLAAAESKIQGDSKPHQAESALHRALISIPDCGKRLSTAGDKMDATLDNLNDERQLLNREKFKLEQARARLGESRGALEAWAAENDEDELQERRRAVSVKSEEMKSSQRKLGRELASIDANIQDKGTEESGLLRSRDKLRAHLQSKELVLDKLRNTTLKRAWSLVKSRQEQGVAKGNTYLPLMEIKAKSKTAASFIERCAGIKKLITMVSDSSVEARECLYGLKGIDVIVVHKVAEPSRRLSAEQLARFGFEGYLDELIEAPPAVIQALRDIASIQNCVVGPENAARAFLALAEEERTRLFEGLQVQTPRTAFSVRRSRYGARNSFMTTHEYAKGLPPAQFIGGAEDSETKRRLVEVESNLQGLRRELTDLNEDRARVASKRDALNAQLSPLDKESANIRKLLEFARKQKVQITTNESDIKSLETRLQALAGKQSPKRTATQVQGAIEALVASVGAMEKMTEKVIAGVPALDEIGLHRVRDASHRLRLATFSTQVHKAQTSLQRAEDEQTIARQQRDENRNARRNLLGKLGKLKVEEENAISELPESREEVLKLRESLRVKVEAIIPDDSVVERYGKLQEEIAELQTEVSSAEERQDDRVSTLRARVDAWTAEVQDLVSKVNANFETGFHRIEEQGYHCAGRVQLDMNAFTGKSAAQVGGRGPEGVSTLATCGVVISVRFRANQALQRLDAHVQSGGERSLTTFLYLLALNNVSKVPFRIVDEINQGMDEEKERISMQHLFSTSCDKTAGSQYFLITPKLLTGLAFPEAATIHVVFNGNGALPQQKVSFGRFLRSRTKRYLADRTNASDSATESVSAPDAAIKRRRTSISCR